VLVNLLPTSDEMLTETKELDTFSWWNVAAMYSLEEYNALLLFRNIHHIGTRIKENS
jgi:hypothetical protein